MMICSLIRLSRIAVKIVSWFLADIPRPFSASLLLAIMFIASTPSLLTIVLAVLIPMFGKIGLDK